MDIYIFLDVDGVLNCETDWKRPFTINKSCVDIFCKLLDLLIKKKYNPHIVLSSTWRAGSSENYKFLENIIKAKNLSALDKTPNSSKTRQEEIEYYIKRHDVKKYIILDDDERLFYDVNKINIYLTNYKTGLIGKDIKNIKWLIKYKKIY